MTRPLTLLAALLLASGSARAQCEPYALTDPDGQPLERFGEAVDADASTMVVGEPGFDGGRGRVLVFRRVDGAWSLEQAVPYPFSGGGPGEFGTSVALDGERFMAGAPGLFDDDGGFAVFERSVDGAGVASWNYIGGLGSNNGSRSRLGHCVDLDGDFAFGGAPELSTPGSLSRGGVYVRELGSATFYSPLISLENIAFGRFGFAIAASNGRLLVGAPLEGTGRVHVYSTLTGPSFQRISLIAPSLPGGSFFGGSVALTHSGVPIAWVGSPQERVNGLFGAGAVRRYTEQPQPEPNPPIYVLGQTFLPAIPREGADFGSSIDVFETVFSGRLVVGAPRGLFEADNGKLHVFSRGFSSGWAESAQFAAFGGGQGLIGTLGSSVALAGTEVVGGYPRYDAAQGDEGGVLIWELDGDDCQDGCEAPRLPAPDLGRVDFAGTSVAIRGDVALVGVPGDDTGGDDAGAVFVYRRDGDCWYRSQRLHAPDASAGDRFGHSVALSPDARLVAVGAPRRDVGASDAGGAYVFFETLEGYLLAETLDAPTPRTNGWFGWSIDADAALMVAVGEPGPGSLSGEASVFAPDPGDGGWIFLDEVLPQVTTQGNAFGMTVAIAQNRLIVGDPNGDQGATDNGAVYGFLRGGSGQFGLVNLISAFGDDGDHFGAAVEWDGDTLLVGAPDATFGGETSAGVVYDWGLGIGDFFLRSVTGAETPRAFERFGNAVAAEGGLLAVGAHAPGLAVRGALHVLQPDGLGWSTLQRVSPLEVAPGSRFGASVGVSNGRVMAGAPDDDGLDGTSRAGSAWIFEADELGLRTTGRDANGNVMRW